MARTHGKRRLDQWLFPDEEDGELHDTEVKVEEALMRSKEVRNARRIRHADLKPQHRVIGVLIALLSGSFDLAQLFFISHALRWNLCYVNDRYVDFEFGPETLRKWTAERSFCNAVLLALHDRDCKAYFKAQEFLAQSILVDVLHHVNDRGLAVPFRWMLSQYVQICSHLYQSPLLRAQLHQLQQGKPFRGKNWARELRKDWPLGHGAFNDGKDLTEEVIVRRVAWGQSPGTAT